MTDFIPNKLDYVINAKYRIKNKLISTGQNVNVPFRAYADLISNIPNTTAITHEDLDLCNKQLLNISGENP